MRLRIDDLATAAAAFIADCCDLHCAAALENPALLNNEGADIDVAHQHAGAGDDELAFGLDVAFYFAGNDDVARLDVGLDDSIFTNRNITCAFNVTMQLAFDTKAGFDMILPSQMVLPPINVSVVFVSIRFDFELPSISVHPFYC